MKERIFKNWNVRRVVYLGVGLAVMIQGIHDKEWFWLLPGMYFAAMGLFGFGCAAGNCYGSSCNATNTKQERIQ